MSWTFTLSGAATALAGVGVSSTILADTTELNRFSDYAEAEICFLTKYDWTTNYASVKTNFVGALGRAAAVRIAMDLINYDMSGYQSKTEAQTKLDYLDNSYNRLIEALKQQSNQEAAGVNIT